MNLFAGARWLISLTSRRASAPARQRSGRHGHRLRPRRDHHARAGIAGESQRASSRAGPPLRAPAAPPLDPLAARAAPPPPRAGPPQTSRISSGAMRLGLAAPLVAARVADDPGRAAGARDRVVVAQCRWPWIHRSARGDQVVVGVAEAGGAAARAVARVGAPQAGREVGDDDGRVPAAARPHQLGFEPGAAGQRLVADRLGVERRGRRASPASGRRSSRRRASPWRGRRRRTGRSRTSASCRRGGSARPRSSSTTRLSRSSMRDAERARSARAAPARRVVEVAAVELVVAGDEDDRLRPAGEALEADPAGCRCRRRGRAARRRAPARGRTLGLEVQVGQELQPHQPRASRLA